MPQTPFLYRLPRKHTSTRQEVSVQALSNAWDDPAKQSRAARRESTLLRKAAEIFANAAALQTCEAVKLLIPCLIFMNFHTSGI